MIANTKQVRSLIRKYFDEKLNSGSYTDKASESDMRLVTLQVHPESNLQDLETEIKFLFFLVGYENRVKVTATRYRKYLRIKASFVA
jgi:hypothetical protein